MTKEVSGGAAVMIRNLTTALRGQLPLYRVRQCNILLIQDEEIGVDCGVTQNIVFVPHIVIIPSDNHLPGSPSQAHLVLAKLRQCLFQCARGERRQRQECEGNAGKTARGHSKPADEEGAGEI